MKREKCNCPQCKIVWDDQERSYRPHCFQYGIWLEYDGRVKIDIEPEHVYRDKKICMVHGRPA